MAEYTFISYTHEDRRFAAKLATQVQRQNVAVWFDQWELSGQIAWDNDLERAIRQSHCFLLILSPAAVNSWLVQQQFFRAKQNNIPLLAVSFQPCTVPAALQDIPCIDFVEPRFGVALRELLHYLQPKREPQLDYGLSLQAKWQALDWRWWAWLRPLLWPGWLGPTLLAALLLLGYLFQRADSSGYVEPVATIETLSIILVTPAPVAESPDQLRPEDSQKMVFVPAGEFFMGSTVDDAEAEADEWPRHAVYLDDFWIDETEITNIQYQACMEVGACTPYRYQGRRFTGDDFPVVGVDWFQASAYCGWAGGRLPTEAEWEKAARGTDNRVYPWGDEFDSTRLNYCDKNCIQDWKDWQGDDGYTYTSPVGTYPEGRSPYGALDMSGNVWEWTADWYDEAYYASSTYRNPTGPLEGQQRVIRGGSWHYAGRNLRAINRHKDTPTFRYDKIGFRCVVSDTTVLAD